MVIIRTFVASLLHYQEDMKTTKATVSVSEVSMFGFYGVWVSVRGERAFLVAKCETRERALELAPAIEKMAWT